MRYHIILLCILILFTSCQEQKQEIEPMKMQVQNITINKTITNLTIETNMTNNTNITKKNYEIAQMTNITCEQDEQCETPGEFLILSHCPYTSKCIDNQCAVICPQPFKLQQNQLNNYPKVSIKECSQRGGRAISIDSDEECQEGETLLGQIIEFISPNICCTPKNKDRISQSKAVGLAMKSECLQVGTITQEAEYDKEKKEWAITLGVDPVKCYPICIVSEIYKKAEVQYRCVGQIANNQNLYLSELEEECKVKKYTCQKGMEKFFDESGCGCKKKVYTKRFCEEKDRTAICTNEDNSACGWLDQGPSCREPPCVNQYKNSCKACINEEILYWTEGECPE